MMLHQNYKQIKLPNEFFVLPARISPKEISGANGKFLPKPLLFHLRHPNSKTNEPKFWQILSPKNSFAKTSSALFRHLPEYLEGRTPKRKMSFPFSEKIGRAQIQKARNIFLWCPPRLCEAVAGLIHSFSFRSKKVRAKCIITAPVFIKISAWHSRLSPDNKIGRLCDLFFVLKPISMSRLN